VKTDHSGGKHENGVRDFRASHRHDDERPSRYCSIADGKSEATPTRRRRSRSALKSVDVANKFAIPISHVAACAPSLVNRNGTGATTPRPSEMALGARYPAVAACAIVSQIRRLVAEGLREGKARYVLSYAPVVGLTSALDDDLVRCRE